MVANIKTSGNSCKTSLGQHSNPIIGSLKTCLLKEVYRYSTSEESLTYAKRTLAVAKFPEWLHPFVLFSSRSSIVQANSFSVLRRTDDRWHSLHLRVASGVKKPSAWISFKNSNPFFLLVTLVQNATTKEHEFKDAFAMPIASLDNIMPVESHYERLVLKLLIQVISNGTNKEDYSIEKPLFVSKTNKGETYRPDFIVRKTSDTTQVFIEVLGSNNEEYNKQKELVTYRAKEYCDAYITIKGYEFEQEKASFAEKLKYHLKI